MTLSIENVNIRAMAIISTGEAAKRLNITVQRVSQLIHENRLKAIMVGGRWLIDEDELESYIEWRSKQGKRFTERFT